jgi:hypothetical protein
MSKDKPTSTKLPTDATAIMVKAGKMSVRLSRFAASGVTLLCALIAILAFNDPEGAATLWSLLFG